MWGLIAVCTLILVKHAMPEIIPTLPAREWQLSDAGQLSCLMLAERLSEHRPDVVITSTEPKAIQTGQIVADKLGIMCEIGDNLHEHERHNESFSNRENFETTIAEFFSHPDQLVYGLESADAAYSRFSQAVENITEKHSGQNIVIVAHGTVITLLLTRKTGKESFPFWQKLGLPSFVVVSLPELTLLKTITEIE